MAEILCFPLVWKVARSFHLSIGELLLYKKLSSLREHSKESSAVKVAQLLWHYCAVQMQGFSIFLTAWQTHSNPQSLSLLMLSDKGAHKARVGCSVPSIPGQYLSLQTQTCQLTSPGLISLRALSWSRKLLSGKDASALGMQLWLPGPKRQQEGEKKGVIRWPLNRRNRVFDSDSAHNTDIICTYMSFEAEKVQSLHSLESLPFLQREETNRHF